MSSISHKRKESSKRRDPKHCSICFIRAIYYCRSCENFALCAECSHSGDGHNMAQIPWFERNEKRNMLMGQALLHDIRCKDGLCPCKDYGKLQRLTAHQKTCQSECCCIRKKCENLMAFHVRRCDDPDCVSMCLRIREHLEKLMKDREATINGNADESGAGAPADDAASSSAFSA